MAATQRVDENLVQHEVAHVIHEQRHKGQNYYCSSDAQIAEAVLDLFHTRGWFTSQESRVTTARTE